MLFKNLYKIENFNLLKQEILNILKINGVDQDGIPRSQLICQGLTPNSNNWDTGIGRIEELDISEEKKYCHLNTDLKGSILESIINRHNAYRTRIMIMHHKSCYSVHSDPSPRLHIPILTNRGNWMVWPNYSKCVHLNTGYVYWTDTTKDHTAFNGTLEQRIHVVMCVDEK